MLLTCDVYGRIAGEAAAEEALNRAGTELRETVCWDKVQSDGKGRPARLIIEELQKYMLRDLLVIRSQEKCSHLRQQLARLKAEAADASYAGMTAWGPYQLRNMLLTAELMLNAAEARKESRGSHYREDFPNENPLYAQPFIIKKQYCQKRKETPT